MLCHTPWQKSEKLLWTSALSISSLYKITCKIVERNKKMMYIISPRAFPRTPSIGYFKGPGILLAKSKNLMRDVISFVKIYIWHFSTYIDRTVGRQETKRLRAKEMGLGKVREPGRKLWMAEVQQRYISACGPRGHRCWRRCHFSKKNCIYW